MSHHLSRTWRWRVGKPAVSTSSTFYTTRRNVPSWIRVSHVLPRRTIGTLPVLFKRTETRVSRNAAEADGTTAMEPGQGTERKIPQKPGAEKLTIKVRKKRSVRGKDNSRQKNQNYRLTVPTQGRSRYGCSGRKYINDRPYNPSLRRILTVVVTSAG